jgi:hypothetical protein
MSKEIQVPQERPYTIVDSNLKPGFTAIFSSINTLAQQEQKKQAMLGGTKVNKQELKTILPVESFLTSYGDKPDLTKDRSVNAWKTETQTAGDTTRSGKRDNIDDVDNYDEDPAGTND